MKSVGFILTMCIVSIFGCTLTVNAIDNLDPLKLKNAKIVKQGFVINQEHRLNSVVTNKYVIDTEIRFYRNDTLVTLEYWNNKYTPADSLNYHLKLEKIKAEKELIKLKKIMDNKK